MQKTINKSIVVKKIYITFQDNTHCTFGNKKKEVGDHLNTKVQ